MPTSRCRATCAPGDTLLLNDGLIALEVTGVEGTQVHTKVLTGGELTDMKGLNKQGGGLSAGALTAKDREDIRMAAKLGVDYLAVSFVRDRKTLRRPGTCCAVPAAKAASSPRSSAARRSTTSSPSSTRPRP